MILNGFSVSDLVFVSWLYFVLFLQICPYWSFSLWQWTALGACAWPLHHWRWVENFNSCIFSVVSLFYVHIVWQMKRNIFRVRVRRVDRMIGCESLGSETDFRLKGCGFHYGLLLNTYRPLMALPSDRERNRERETERERDDLAERAEHSGQDGDDVIRRDSAASQERWHVREKE